MESKSSLFKVLAVASGPAQEIVDLVESKDQEFFTKVEFSLLDQDARSLSFAQRGILEAAKRRNVFPVVHMLNQNIKKLLVEGAGEKYDLIYSAGLFDYFDDSIAARVAKALFDSLKENGKLVIGNFRSEASHQTLMEWALDWTLIYRNADELKKLYSPITQNLKIESEPESINLFAVFNRN
jgi:SAM-dependent methyltransferase